MPTPEESARQQIDEALRLAGWPVQDVGDANVHASRGVAIREFPLKQGHGFADYLLYVDGKAAGVVEAKKTGDTLTGVETQAAKYSEGLPDALPAHQRPLPFLYQSTGVETRFTNWLDPVPRSRRVFHFHRPETLARWLAEFPSTLRKRLRDMPPIIEEGLWRAQLKAVRNLERSFAEDRPRALVQMATGSGKTFTAVTAIYRLIKFAEVPRVLFLVDRANLGRQTLKEFQQYVTPDDGRKFTELYNVQHLSSNRLDPVARVCITTIQRLFSMLKGQPDLTGGTGNGFAGDSFVIAGFTNAGNNGTFTCTASTATTLTCSNTAGVTETHAGTATTNGTFNWALGAISINPSGADIGVTTTVGSAVFLGQSTTYNITVFNNGTSAANAVVLTDTLAAGMTLNSVML